MMSTLGLLRGIVPGTLRSRPKLAALRGYLGTDRLHPDEPHWYLARTVPSGIVGIRICLQRCCEDFDSQLVIHGTSLASTRMSRTSALLRPSPMWATASGATATGMCRISCERVGR